VLELSHHPQDEALSASAFSPSDLSCELRRRFGLYTPDDLAELLDLDARTLAVWRAQKRGPDFVRAGRAVFYRRCDIEAWLALNVIPVDRTGP
jgi:hypothetical protein